MSLMKAGLRGVRLKAVPIPCIEALEDDLLGNEWILLGVS